MPSLVAGYAPAADPGVGEASTGLIGQNRTVEPRDAMGSMLLRDSRGPVAGGPHPVGPELAVPGVDRAMVAASPARFDRSPIDDDADTWRANQGEHVAQVAGHAEPHGTQPGEPPMYGSTWRMEPQPADSGWYVGVGYA